MKNVILKKIAKTINRPKKTFFDGVSIVVDRMLRDIKLN